MDKIKLGILLDDVDLPAWAFQALECLQNLECSSVQVILLNGGKDTRKSQRGYAGDELPWAARLFSSLDKAVFQRGADALALRNVHELFPSLPVRAVTPVREAGVEHLSAADLEYVARMQLDVLVKFGFDHLEGGILEAARFGVWAYQHGDGLAVHGTPPCFWEVIDQKPETVSMLYKMESSSGIGTVLYQSWSQTFIFSPVRSRNRCLWKSSPFLARQIELLYRLGADRFFEAVKKYNLEPPMVIRHHRSNSVISFLWAYLRLFVRNVAELIRRALFLDQWSLAFDVKGSPLDQVAQYKNLVPPKDRFWADPHGIQAGDRYHIFIEEYVYQAKRAHISVLEIQKDGTSTPPVAVLARDYHLSYPFVFEWEHKYYMLPETVENRSIELYECVEFPFKWKFCMKLMEDVLAVDTTLLYENGKWWLFSGIAETEGVFPEVELFVYYSTNLFSNQWLSHPLNPVVSDVRNARPAGKIFRRNGKIFRPSQDCSFNYGWSFNLNEIEVLTETRYQERSIYKLTPGWDKHIQATHTYLELGDFTMIDVCKWLPRYQSIASQRPAGSLRATR